MYQTIGETISVVGTYKPGGVFQPVKFLWAGKQYLIEEITLISELKDGATRRRMYSVLVRGTLYRLLFNRASEAWILEELWVE